MYFMSYAANRIYRTDLVSEYEHGLLSGVGSHAARRPQTAELRLRYVCSGPSLQPGQRGFRGWQLLGYACVGNPLTKPRGGTGTGTSAESSGNGIVRLSLHGLPDFPASIQTAFWTGVGQTSIRDQVGQ